MAEENKVAPVVLTGEITTTQRLPQPSGEVVTFIGNSEAAAKIAAERLRQTITADRADPPSANPGENPCALVDFQADNFLTCDQLDAKYNPDGDGEHPTYPRSSWREAVGAQQTLMSYWKWVKYQLSQD